MKIANIVLMGFIGCLTFVSIISCKGIYDNVEPYGGEKVYPAKFDTISGKIGFERVELDLMKAGRIPSDQIYLGKASKTVVEYDKERIVIDSVVSWVNIPNLELAKLYRFKVYTEDQYGNKSVPQEIALIPYTKNELTTIAVQSPRVFASPSTAVLDWAEKISSILLTYCDLEFSYKDQAGVVHKGERDVNPRIFAGNLKSGDEITVDINYRVVPKVNGVEILDTLVLNQATRFYMPSPTTNFIPTEVDILKKNGVTEFNSIGVSGIKKLVFPLETKTLQDLFYFSSLDEIDLTGGTLFKMTTSSYSNNGASLTVGGDSFFPYVRRPGNMAEANARFLIDLLENDLVKKVKYIPHSFGIDHLLEPFLESGKVELVATEDEPLLPLNYFVSGLLQTATLRTDIEKNPLTYPPGQGLENVMKVTLKDRSASIIFKLPADYQLNTELYPFLRLKVYAPDISHFPGVYDNYKIIWPRLMNRIWAFPNDSPYGQELWNTVKGQHKLTNDQLETWVDMKIDISGVKGLHSRVILINIGGEPSITGGYKPAKEIVYHFANIRLSKN